jgi:hypothetical protein
MISVMTYKWGSNRMMWQCNLFSVMKPFSTYVARTVATIFVSGPQNILLIHQARMGLPKSQCGFCHFTAKYCHVYEWLSKGFGLEIGVIDHFNTRLVTKLNYSTNADLQTLKITTAYTKYLQSADTSRCPVTDLNNWDSSASVLNCTD